MWLGWQFLEKEYEDLLDEALYKNKDREIGDSTNQNGKQRAILG